MWQQYNFLASKLSPEGKPTVGISACLAGNSVRYDGTDKKHPEILGALQPLVALEPLCPEVAIGMGVPRPPIQLVVEQHEIGALRVDRLEKKNYAQPLTDFAQHIVNLHNTAQRPLSGYIFKSRSPSCGLGSTPIFKRRYQTGVGNGIYAGHIAHMLPGLPVAEECDLLTSEQCDYFIFRVLIMYDLQLSERLPEGLAYFHRHHAPFLEVASRRYKIIQHVPSVIKSPRSDLAVAPHQFAHQLNKCLIKLGAARLKNILTAL